MTTDANLVILPGPTLREGLDNLGQPLASVTPIRGDFGGKRAGNCRHYDNSLAECECSEWSARRCPKHWPEAYSKSHARHLGVTA
jgi:hypothetical protein